MYPTVCLNDAHVTSLIDGDVVAYRAACVSQSEDMDENQTAAVVHREVTRWAAMGDDTIVCLSLGRSFRYDAYPDYKSNRKDKPKPPALGFCYQVLRDAYRIQERDTWEADDVMGVLATCGKLECPLIVTIDKDLRQVPGWHWNPLKERWPVWVTPEQGEFLRHLQWLCGDPTDGYGGIPKVGPKKAEKLLKGDWGFAPDTLEGLVADAYQDANLGPDWETYMGQMDKCSKILQAQ